MNGGMGSINREFYDRKPTFKEIFHCGGIEACLVSDDQEIKDICKNAGIKICESGCEDCQL